MPNETSIIIDDKAVKEKLAELSKRLKDLSPVMRDIADILYQSVTNQFLAGGIPRWATLSDITKEAREKIGKWPGSILQVSGRLRNSIHPYHDENTAGVGTNVEYATTMHFGAKRGEFGNATANVREHTRRIKGRDVKVKAHTRTIPVPFGTIPARPFMVVSDVDIGTIQTTLTKWITPESF